MQTTYIAAVVQATPNFLDNNATLRKVNKLVEEAVKEGAQLILFPESFFPGYPRGLSFGASVGHRTEAGRQLWQQYWQCSVELGDEIDLALRQLAKTYEVLIVMGVTERDSINGSLYCSMLIYNTFGELCHRHRKIKPTGSERIIWAEGDGTSIKSITTNLGRIGGLICWENMMPLARTALYQRGIDIYLAPTADSRPGWTASMQHIAREGRCWVLAANQFFQLEDYPDEIRTLISDEAYPHSHGGSVIISPLGEITAGPVFDAEQIIYTQVDLGKVVESRLDFDPIGHYSRPDLLELQIKQTGADNNTQK